MRTALVHDYLTQFGGAERVLHQLHRMYPDAPIYTLLADDDVVADRFPDADVRPSFLQSFPWPLRNRHLLLPLSAAAVERFDLGEYDCIISSTASFAKGVLTRPETAHICYCHTPTRYLWDDAHAVLRERSMVARLFARPVMHWLRVWDRQAAERPTVLVANSQYTRKRIESFYGRRAVVVYPPVGWDDFDDDSPEAETQRTLEALPDTYYLVVAHLRRFKRVDAVVNAFNRLKRPLVIVGNGPEERRLRRAAGDTVHFLGQQPDSVLQILYRQAQAVIVPSVEDFGIVAVEAQWAGTPVLAYRSGGATETVLDGVTGEFFDEQSSAMIADAVRRMDERGVYDQDAIRAHGRQFPPIRFRTGMQRVIKRCLQAKKDGTV